MAINSTMPDLAVEFQKIYDSEVNVRIGWFWHGGIDIRLGDGINCYLAEEAAAEIVHWLQEAIAHFYPGSPYASSLSPEVSRARQTTSLPAAEYRRQSDLPRLWRAPCGTTRYG